MRYEVVDERWRTVHTTVTLRTWWEYDAFAAQAEARGYFLRRVP